jgi:hypothetical protein
MGEQWGKCVMRTKCQAVIMGDRSGADGTHIFEIDDELTSMPADDVVEQFMNFLYDSEYLSNRYAYELNAAIRGPESSVIMAMGTVTIKEQRLPFTVMISEEKTG